MRRLQRAFCAVFVLLLIAGKAFGQNSNIGTEFWTGWMDHIDPSTGKGALSQMNLYIAGDVATTVTISSAGTDFTPFTVSVTPNNITTVPISANCFLGNTNGGLKGIHIVSQDPVAVYAHIYASSVSGATLLLPVNTLSNDYYSINYTQISNAVAYSTFMVIATADSTTVQITTTGALLDNHAAGSTFTVSLQKGEIYQGVSATDLTGSHISSISTATQGCKRIAMFSGSSKIAIGTPNITSDNLFQQVYPTPSWGKNYITIPLKNRNYDVMRIVVSDTTAVIKIDGAANPYKLINGLYYEFNTQTSHFITANKPIQVVQYAVTQGDKIDGKTTLSTDVGDPEMIFLNPLEQTIDHVTLYSPHEYLILASYINVVIPTAAASSFVLDGAAPPGGFTPVPNNTAYSYGQFTVSNATHVILASQGFNAIAYGFGQAESYGYAAGTNVKDLNEFVQVVNPTTLTVASTGCTNDNYIPQVAIPYQTTTITWDLGNGTTPTTQTNPTYTDTLHRNDTTLYVYNYGKPVAYAAGTYPIKVTVVDPINTLCGSTEEIDLNYTVVAPPQAKFAARDSVCTADTVGFKDLTDGSVNPVAKWHWDFGDNDTSNVQNPVYTYKQPGNYTVVLTTTGSTGCVTSGMRSIHVSILPVAKFTTTPPLCQAPLTVAFTDQSTSAEGKITSWLWDFGDNTTSTLQNPTHAYSTAGQTYVVSLTVVTAKGCPYTTKQNVFINYSPTVDFGVPDVCQADFYAHFNAVTSIMDSTVDKLTYQWNFGDPAANATYPNTATGKTAQHHYINIGVYNVTLTVTTQNGCVKDTIKQLSVNGSNPHAAFSIPGNGNLCSNQPVTFINMADVPGFNQGKVTSFTMDFGDGSAKQTYRLDSGGVFTHQYPLAYVKAVTKYAVTMVAASGASAICSNTFTDTVRILPVPKTTFAPPDSVCQNFGTLKLASYITEPTGAPAGSPTFLIDGIRSPDGSFNTGTVGVGKHKITCYYIVSATSCADTTYATIKVEPAPAVYAGSPVIILAGAQAKLHATIIGGNNNVISWLPTTGLSDPTSASPTASPALTTKYKITVTSTTDALACPATDSVTVTVLLPPIVPNAFTPNGDGTNDKWVITNLAAYPNCIVSVYNRNGERVFYSVGYGIPWDGRYNSVNLPVGTYYYVIDPKNGRSIISGYVAIIR